MSRWLMITGLILLVVGVALHFAPWLFNWFGRLPGDIRIESGRTRFYFPIVSMIIVSLILSLLINLFHR
ncbi:DUF2905 domain-containing protein [Microbulbifer sp. CnH-101-G]|uniref:DUF2905 domain-containing protein n=1 Tax=Microbulbifer sp. CnH-101-G TaxID=3243393 RepID=UPI00403A58AB